ncbi:MAG: type II toxin-antitoxin system VapC family toxin [Terriglobales bacterium]
MRLLLDTAAFIYAVEMPEHLSRRANSALQNVENILELSAISITEIAIKAALGKLKLSADTIRHSIQDLDIRIMSYTVEHALRFFEVPLHHRDPFDRQIIAQALAEKIPVVTPDEKFMLYSGLKIIW